MAEYNLEQKLQQMTDMLEALTKEVKAQNIPVVFYKDFFAGEAGRILYLQLNEPDLHDQVNELLQSALESKDGQNVCTTIGKGIFDIAYDISKEDDAKEFATAMVQSIQEELTCQATVGMSDIFTDLNQIQTAYDHAKQALEAGRKLITNQIFYDYENLGIAKVVWNMTTEQCEQFLKETLNTEAEKELQNKEMLESIDVFFQSNLNISVAARELYVHRNTLVYRIEKFNKVSGYNLSEFHDAALVQFILMVRRKIAND